VEFWSFSRYQLGIDDQSEELARSQHVVDIAGLFRARRRLQQQTAEQLDLLAEDGDVRRLDAVIGQAIVGEADLCQPAGLLAEEIAVVAGLGPPRDGRIVLRIKEVVLTNLMISAMLTCSVPSSLGSMPISRRAISK